MDPKKCKKSQLQQHFGPEQKFNFKKNVQAKVIVKKTVTFQTIFGRK
jgi:hypothetical protein